MFTPKEGYKIGDVIINGTSLGAISSYTFSKTTSNQNICVEFEKIKHSISILVGNGGTTDVNGTVEVDDKATLSINITPNEKFRINSIKINGIDTQISKTLTIVDISGNILVEIAFEQFEFSITTSYIGKGSVTPSVTVKSGNAAEIEFSADKGYEISRVSVNGEDVVFTDNKLLIENVRCDIDIVVVFEKNDTYAAVTFVSVSAFLVFGAILYTVRITKIRKKRK